MEKFKISDRDIRMAKILKAMGNPVRLSILRTLIERSLCPHGSHPCNCVSKCEGETCKCGCKCGELVDLFPISQSTVSQHIKELKKAGLIETKGRKGDYTLNHDNLKEGLSFLLDMTGYNYDSLASGIKECHCCG